MADPSDAAVMQWLQKLPWYSQFKRHYGEEPNLNGDYDYRAAMKLGITPAPYPGDVRNGEVMYHWPSSAPNGVPLKTINHPTAWMEDYMRATGGRDPITNPSPTLTPMQLQQMQNALQIRYGRPITSIPQAEAGQRRLHEIFQPQ